MFIAISMIHHTITENYGWNRNMFALDIWAQSLMHTWANIEFTTFNNYKHYMLYQTIVILSSVYT